MVLKIYSKQLNLNIFNVIMLAFNHFTKNCLLLIINIYTTYKTYGNNKH